MGRVRTKHMDSISSLLSNSATNFIYNFRGKIPIESFELPTDINQLDVLGEMGFRASLR